MKLIPPAATKAVIDYVVLVRPVPEAVTSWLPFSVPESPKLRLFGLVALGLAWWSVLGKFRIAEPLGRQPERRSESRSQSAAKFMSTPCGLQTLHRVYELKSGGALRACCAKTPAASAS